jgi:hypothetical protein
VGVGVGVGVGMLFTSRYAKIGLCFAKFECRNDKLNNVRLVIDFRQSLMLPNLCL